MTIIPEKQTPETRQRIEDFTAHAVERVNRVFTDTFDLTDSHGESLAIAMNVISTMVLMAAEYSVQTGFTRDQRQFFRAFGRFIHEMEPAERKKP